MPDNANGLGISQAAQNKMKRTEPPANVVHLGFAARLEWAWRQTARIGSARVIVVFLYVAYRVTETDGYTFRSREDIARHVGCKVRQVAAALDRLERLGYIARVEAKRRYGQWPRTLTYLCDPEAGSDSPPAAEIHRGQNGAQPSASSCEPEADFGRAEGGCSPTSQQEPTSGTDLESQPPPARKNAEENNGVKTAPSRSLPPARATEVSTDSPTDSAVGDPPHKADCEAVLELMRADEICAAQFTESDVEAVPDAEFLRVARQASRESLTTGQFMTPETAQAIQDRIG
jgi:helix-turn-helix protein